MLDKFPSGFFPLPADHVAHSGGAAAAVGTVGDIDRGNIAPRLGATECCALSGFNSFCADTENTEGVVINFELDDAPAVSNGLRSKRGAFQSAFFSAAPGSLPVGASNLSGKVALSGSAPSAFVVSTGSDGTRTSAEYAYTAFPAFQTVGALVNRRHPDGSRCDYRQMVAAAGEPVMFNQDTECIQVCNRARRQLCTLVMFCAKPAPVQPSGSSIPTRFHFGVSAMYEPTRSLNLAMLEAQSAFGEFTLNLRASKSCDDRIGDGWDATGTVQVVANPRIGRYMVIIRDFSFYRGDRGAKIGDVLVYPLNSN
jgi:hypothetical protein